MIGQWQKESGRLLESSNYFTRLRTAPLKVSILNTNNGRHKLPYGADLEGVRVSNLADLRTPDLRSRRQTFTRYRTSTMHIFSRLPSNLKDFTRLGWAYVALYQGREGPQKEGIELGFSMSAYTF